MLHPLLAQERRDSTRYRLRDSRLSKRIMKTVTRKSPAMGGPVKNQKSEDVFMPYEGKIIREIIVNHAGFERSIYDTTRTIRNSVIRVANALHADTRERVIRNNLFFWVNRPLNPYRLADNERYLRDLDFILDSKIVVHPVGNMGDSVDVEVITRDVFSFGIRPRLGGLDKITLGVYDANLFGYGQRIQTNVLFENGRTPFVGYDVLYRKSSLGGTLINATLGYTQIDNAASVGEENEYAYYFRLERPLVSPYSRMAGGLEISKNWSRNVFSEWDSLFAKYRYDVKDVWVGYNIGVKNNVRNRSRHFIALRYFNQAFKQQPLQENERVRRIYNNQRFLLGEMTFYNQNFYKTNYVYGFGRTEDVPYGQTVNFTLGWSQEVGLSRTYVGTYAIRRVVRPSGRFFDLEAGAGTFFYKDRAEDGTIYVNGTYYSKVYEIRRNRVRHQIGGGYARAFNNRIRDLLTLNNELRGFTADSLYGYQRLYARTETTIFTRGQIIGFRFAPFLSLEGSFFQRDKEAHALQKFYWGSTGGLRIRNENLIFGTIEFRTYFFPTRVKGVDPVAFKITTNVRIKYSGNFVRPPDFVRYN